MNKLPPPLLAMFHKRITGDNCLLRLARLRFNEAGIGPEYHANSIRELEDLMEYRPDFEKHAFLHLPRGLNVLKQGNRDYVGEYASLFQGRVTGFVLHDQEEANVDMAGYAAAIIDLGARLKQDQRLYIEYAVGLDPGIFLEIIKSMGGEKNIGVCLDIGHIGLREIYKVYSRKNKGANVFALNPFSSGIGQSLDAVEEAKKSALPLVLKMIKEVGALGGPAHFHLHDGHPLSRLSPLGLADHLGFLEKIPIPVKWKGNNFLEPMFGISGLKKIIKNSMELIKTHNLSYTLEIHPAMRRLPLGAQELLFPLWKDLTNAEIMNHWLCGFKEIGGLINGIVGKKN